MYPILNLKKNLIAGLLLSGSVAAATAASSLTKSGVEYPIIPSMARDQVLPNLSLGQNGGYIVSQDPTIDGNGIGIRARRLYSDLSGFRTTFPVNSITSGDQQKARVAVLPAGGAVFAWQSSTSKGHRIYVRFLGANDIFTGPETPASEVMVGHQSDAAVAVLKDGSVVVVWGEEGRDGNMQGIFGQRFSATGTRLGGTFQVNTVTHLNQRSPAIAALSNGGFVVAWVSDEFRQRNSEHIDIAARIFNASAVAIGNDFALNTKIEICANPSLAATASGFRAAWSSFPIAVPSYVRQDSEEVLIVDGTRVTNDVNVVTGSGNVPINSWDVSTRVFDLQGTSSAVEQVVNTTRQGDQFSPRLISFRDRELVLWTSFGQDGSDEGIYGRVAVGTTFEADEFLVNSFTKFKQVFPTASVIGDKLVVAWASFRGAASGFDVVAQQYSISGDDSLAQPAVPFASALSQKAVSITWAEIGAQPVAAYRVHVDNEAQPVEAVGGMVTITRDQWTPGSTHTFRLSYRLEDGRTSPLSDPISVLTWGADDNADGIPDDWQRDNWGKVWPSPSADSDGDGASNLAEFLAGTDPTDAGSVLKVQLSLREEGMYVEWRTNPGGYYQLQVTSDFSQWINVGPLRFAPSDQDAIPADVVGQTQYFRVIRMR